MVEKRRAMMAMFVRNCDLILEATGAHVMVIHHTSKDEECGARSSSALRAAVDHEIQVTSEWGILSRKQRDQEPPELFYLKLRSVSRGYLGPYPRPQDQQAG